MASELDAHYKAMYVDAVRQLAGSPERSLLPEFVGKENKQGEAVFIDSIGPDDDARVTEFSAVPTRAKYEAIVQKAIADWNAIQTPHMNALKKRTLITPSKIDWGHTMDSVDKIGEVTDPQSRTLRQGMSRIWLKRDALILNALAAASVMRGKDQGAVEAEAFPVGQILTPLACYGDDPEYFDNTVVSSIRKLFKARYYNGRILCVISPQTEKDWIDHSGNTISNKDFVDGPRYFMNGELPTIYGVSFIVHPLCPDTEYLAWGPDGLVWNQFSPFAQDIGIAATQQFNAIAYMREFAGCRRVDDNLVVQGAIVREAPES